MILNPDKCYFLNLGFQDGQANFSYDNMTIKNASGKILGIAIEKSFEKYLQKKTIKNLMHLLE